MEWAVAGSFYDPVKPADGVLTCFIRGLFPLFSRGWFPGDGVCRAALFLEGGGSAYIFLGNCISRKLSQGRGSIKSQTLLWALQETGIKCRATVFLKFLECRPELPKDSQRNTLSPTCPVFHLEA